MNDRIVDWTVFFLALALLVAVRGIDGAFVIALFATSHLPGN